MNFFITTIAVVLLAMFPPRAKNFSGVWELDKKKSVNLPSSFAQVESYTMDVRQTPDSMIIIVGLSGNGQNVKFPVNTYVFNGAEVFREDTLRFSRRWTTCSWASGGSKLIVTSRVEQGAGDKKKEYTQRDEWQLTDAKTIQIAISQAYKGSDSTRTERRLFHKMK